MARAAAPSTRSAELVQPIASRSTSRPSPLRETPVSSTGEDDSYEEDDNDEEDEDVEEEDDEDDNEEEEEEDGYEQGSNGFDEQFLAQLLAFDPSFANLSGGNVSLQNSDSRLKGEEQISFNGAMQRDTNDDRSNPSLQAPPSTFFPSVPVPASSSTPSNEFYDGAINFLTEILGSSTPSFWKTGGTGMASPAAEGADLSWMNRAHTPGTAALASSSNNTFANQFKNLQPLISNLIARLKGFPVQEGLHQGQSMEDDLVLLLQSLMAHRQAQQSGSAQITQAESSTLAPKFSAAGSFNPQEVRESHTAGSHFHPGQELFGQQPGFSIVDFDFGDDDDDPDFVPNNVKLDFASSKEFAEALAQVSATPVAPIQSEMQTEGGITMSKADDGAAWQQLIASIQTAEPASQTKDDPPPFSSHNHVEGRTRRTRSATRDVVATSLGKSSHQEAPLNIANTRSQLVSSTKSGTDMDDLSEGHDPEEFRWGSEEATKGETKRRGRKPLSREEALQRRRESNKECARRGRLRKKQEEEEIRQEFERLRKARLSNDDANVPVLPAGLQRKKRGRPLGSKTYTTKDDRLEDGERVADLKADNRMLRAEMHRLIGENIQLRARMMRYEDVEGVFGEGLGGRRGIKRRGSAHFASDRDDSRAIEHDPARQGRRRAHEREPSIPPATESGGDDSFDDDEALSDERFLTRSLASRGLAYDPFKSFRVPSARRDPHESRIVAPHREEVSGREHVSNEAVNSSERRGATIEQLVQSLIVQQKQSDDPKASLQEVLQAAADSLGGARGGA